MTVFILKLIACFTMLIDHTGAIFFPRDLFLRVIGRLSFPIFAFLIAGGAVHTSNKLKYLGRLFLLALISELPFQLAFFGSLSFPPTRNIFFTLFLGLLGVVIFIWLKDEWHLPGMILGIFVMIACGVTAVILQTDYGYMGVLMITLLYFSYGKKWLTALSLILCNSIFMLTDLIAIGRAGHLWMLSQFGFTDWLSMCLQMFGILAVIPIILYNGKLGPKYKWAFYFFYPVHLTVLWLINYLIR